MRQIHLSIAFLVCLWINVGAQKDCRFTTKEPRGVITTPNFPKLYPIPIKCQWVIEAPADKVIAVYFSQFYMREGLRATEYAYYSKEVKMGKTDFGTISSDREPTYLVSNKPVLVLDFTVKELANIHMRVREFLLDVFGFNITYEMIGRNESIRKDACLDHHCSFTGNCYASSQYDRYSCSCFAKYFGDECQYDSDCGPTASRNMCQNGGTCRHYIGSTVRTCECPPGYDGARCGTKKDIKQYTASAECIGPHCNQTCVQNLSLPGHPKQCNDTLTEQQRYVISLKVTNPKANVVLSDRRKLENFKKEMEQDFHLLFKSRFESRNITVLELWSDSIMKFHFLAKVIDEEEIKSTVDQMLKLGKLGVFDFDPDFFELESQPALSIDRMETSEKMPIVEGQELTLACMVKGTESLQVEWFKDGIAISLHNNLRGVWTTRVPKNSHKQYTALLGFDRAADLDSGVFTCKVTDWDFVENMSIAVTVLAAPQPQITPMTATIFKGEQLVITCLSEEDIYGTFGYTWLKNDRIINPRTEPEMIEDLFPAGSRVLLRSASSSATYSCIITSSTGSNRKDSVITVLDTEHVVPSCPTNDYIKVRWMFTATNSEDRQLCPSGYTGDVTRRCSLSSSMGAYWEEPDFSGCLSNSFLSIRKKVDTLRLGYLLTDITSVLLKLKRYLLLKKQKLHVSEGEPVVDILQDIYSLDHIERDSKTTWTVFLDIASLLFETPHLLRKHAKVIQLREQVFQFAFQYVEEERIGIESFSTNFISVHIGKFRNEEDYHLQFPASLSPYDESMSWLHNSAEFTLSSLPRDQVEIVNGTRSAVVVFYKDFASYLPQRFLSKMRTVDAEYQLVSGLVEVQVKREEHSLSLIEKEYTIRTRLESFNFSVESNTGWNLSCAMADFSQGQIKFVTNECELIETTGNVTLCECHKLGVYALLLAHYNLPVVTYVEHSFEVIAGVGCAIGAFFLLITTLLLFFVWRKVRRAITAFKLQVCIALLGAYVTFFCGLSNSVSEEFYMYIAAGIQFFLLSSFTLQLCLSLVVYVRCFNLRNVYYSPSKIAALGWTVPVIVVGATLAAQSLESYKLKKWWLELGSTFFYAYTCTILILALFQVLLFLTVKSEIRNHGKVADFLQKQKARISTKRLKLLQRSLLLTTVLLLLSVASVLYINFDSKVYQYFFAITSSLLGFFVFMFYTFCSEKHFILRCMDETSKDHHDHEVSPSVSRNNSLKSFLKSDLMEDAYSHKLHLEAERRSDRIKRMYTQIEKASFPKVSNPYQTSCVKTTADLLAHHPNISSENPPPQGFIVSSLDSIHNSPSKDFKDSDTFHSASGDYPCMQWREGYPQTPSSFGHLQQPVLMESSADYVNKFHDTSGTFEDMSHHELLSAAFRPSHIVKADVNEFLTSKYTSPRILKSTILADKDTEVHRVPDAVEECCSLKNTCFAHCTDSMETVVYCEEGAAKQHSETAKPLHTQSWNTTTV